MDGNIISVLSFILHTLNFDLVLNLIKIALKIYLIYIMILKLSQNLNIANLLTCNSNGNFNE
jgi:hypothetical protein